MERFEEQCAVVFECLGALQTMVLSTSFKRIKRFGNMSSCKAIQMWPYAQTIYR